MSHRNNFYRQEFEEYLKSKEWSPEDIERVARKIGHSATGSFEFTLNILRDVAEVDERIAAEKEFDEVFAPVYTLPDRDGEALAPGQLFNPDKPVIPQDFFETGYDSEGRYINPAGDEA